MIFQLLISTKMLKNKDSFFQTLKCFINWHFNVYEHDKFHAQFSWVDENEKSFLTPGLISIQCISSLLHPSRCFKRTKLLSRVCLFCHPLWTYVHNAILNIHVCKKTTKIHKGEVTKIKIKCTTCESIFLDINVILIKHGVEIIKLFSHSAQMIMKFILLINVKMPAIVGILVFISLINTTSESFKARKIFITQQFSWNSWSVEYEKSFKTSGLVFHAFTLPCLMTSVRSIPHDLECQCLKSCLVH